MGQSYCPTRDSDQLLLLLNSASKPLGWLLSHPKVLYSFCGRYFIVNVSPPIQSHCHHTQPTSQPCHTKQKSQLRSHHHRLSHLILTQTEWLNKQTNKMPTISVYKFTVKKHVGKFNLLIILMFCGFCCCLFQLFLSSFSRDSLFCYKPLGVWPTFFNNAIWCKFYVLVNKAFGCLHYMCCAISWRKIAKHICIIEQFCTIKYSNSASVCVPKSIAFLH